MSHHSKCPEPRDYNWTPELEAMIISYGESIKENARFQRYLQECNTAEEKKGAPLELEDFKRLFEKVKNDLEDELGFDCSYLGYLEKRGTEVEGKNAGVAKEGETSISVGSEAELPAEETPSPVTASPTDRTTHSFPDRPDPTNPENPTQHHLVTKHRNKIIRMLQALREAQSVLRTGGISMETVDGIFVDLPRFRTSSADNAIHRAWMDTGTLVISIHCGLMKAIKKLRGLEHVFMASTSVKDEERSVEVHEFEDGDPENEILALLKWANAHDKSA